MYMMNMQFIAAFFITSLTCIVVTFEYLHPDVFPFAGSPIRNTALPVIAIGSALPNVQAPYRTESISSSRSYLPFLKSYSAIFTYRISAMTCFVIAFKRAILVIFMRCIDDEVRFTKGTYFSKKCFHVYKPVLPTI